MFLCWKTVLSLNLPPSLLPEMALQNNTLWQPDHFQPPRGGPYPRRRERRRMIDCMWWRLYNRRTELLGRGQPRRRAVLVHSWRTATFKLHRVFN